MSTATKQHIKKLIVRYDALTALHARDKAEAVLAEIERIRKEGA
jgi:hypothetical protein